MPVSPKDINVGDTVRLTFDLSDDTGLTDATEVTMVFYRPDGTPASTQKLSLGQLSHPSTGRYQGYADMDVPGLWYAKTKGEKGATVKNSYVEWFVNNV